MVNPESGRSIQYQNGQSRDSEWSIQSQNGVDDFHAPLPMLEQWALTSIHPLRGATVFSASTFQN